jgi:polar amino acid transport system substrate-binding protein
MTTFGYRSSLLSTTGNRTAGRPAVSVARAHTGFIDLHPELELEVVTVGAEEKPPALGCFGFAKADNAFRQMIDEGLGIYFGSRVHRRMMLKFGFSDTEIDLVVT